MDDFEIARRARMMKAYACTLGEARICLANGSQTATCEGCGWRQDEVERRRRLPMFRNDKGLWQKRVGHREVTTFRSST